MTQSETTEQDGSTLGQRLRTMREAAGLDRATVAKRVGVDLTTLARWERDERTPAVDAETLVSDAVAEGERAAVSRYVELSELGDGELIARLRAVAEEMERRRMRSIEMKRLSGAARRSKRE